MLACPHCKKLFNPSIANATAAKPPTTEPTVAPDSKKPPAFAPKANPQPVEVMSFGGAPSPSSPSAGAAPAEVLSLDDDPPDKNQAPRLGPPPVPPALRPSGRQRFTADTAAAPAPKKRPPINHAVVVSGVIAGTAATYWLTSVVGLAGKYMGGSVFGLFAALFLGAVMGGMCASTLSGVGRFRHSLYAGLSAFAVQLLFIVPMVLMMLWYGSVMAQLASSKPTDDPLMTTASLLKQNYLWAILGVALAPFVMVGGFLLGGGLDALLTSVARAGGRERWTYHAANGKSFPVFGPWRSPIIAICWTVVGWGALLTCWVPMTSFDVIGVVSSIGLGQACRRMARKYRGVSAKFALENDRRPPIVYLRSFQDDGLFQPGVFLLVNDWLRTLNEKTVEDNLSTCLAPFGPVVAIGRPDEEMPEVGAARIYVDDDHWQDLILDLLGDRGALAVLQAGGTQGLRWEMNVVATRLKPEQVLMFLPFGLYRTRSRRGSSYRAFTQWADSCAPASLPEDLEDNVYFFYFTGHPVRSTRTLRPGDRVPRDHPLGDMLVDLQRNNAIRPWTLLNTRRLARLMGCGIVLGLISLAWKSLNPPTAASTEAPAVEVVPKISAMPRLAPTHPRLTRYEGRAKPYHISLDNGWTRKTHDDNQDLSFERGETSLQVLLIDKANPAENFTDEYVKGMRAAVRDGKRLFESVDVVDRRIVRLNGGDWQDFKLKLQVGAVTVWQRVRGYAAGTEAYVLIVTQTENNDDLDKIVTEALNGFELPRR